MKCLPIKTPEFPIQYSGEYTIYNLFRNLIYVLEIKLHKIT